jgi:hypothetical protein
MERSPAQQTRSRVIPMFISSAETPASYHADLYRYWDRARGTRPRPARRDIDPIEILPLLPHLAIVDRDGEGYRWRLMGTTLVDDFGNDLTGRRFGGYVAPAPLVQAMIKTFNHVLADSQPTFELSVYKTSCGALQSVSRMLLPLSTPDDPLGMVMFTRITRFQFGGILHEDDQLKAAIGRWIASYDIQSIEQLQVRVHDWERSVGSLRQRVGLTRDGHMTVLGSPADPLP